LNVIEFGPRLFGICQFLVVAYIIKHFFNFLIYLLYKDEVELELPWTRHRDLEEEKNKLAI